MLKGSTLRASVSSIVWINLLKVLELKGHAVYPCCYSPLFVCILSRLHCQRGAQCGVQTHNREMESRASRTEPARHPYLCLFSKQSCPPPISSPLPGGRYMQMRVLPWHRTLSPSHTGNTHVFFEPQGMTVTALHSRALQSYKHSSLLVTKTAKGNLRYLEYNLPL